MPNDNRNFIIFIVITLILVTAYENFVIAPTEKRRQAEQQRAHAVEVQEKQAGLAPNGQPVAVRMTRDQALEVAPRVRIDTPALSGSISLAGARLDDLFLKQYRQTTGTNSPSVELLRPRGADNSYYATNGWVGAPGAPDEDALWTQTSSGPLTPSNPLELTYQAPTGLTFRREIKVDPQYLFTVTDTVENHGTAPVNIAPYGAVQRRGVPPDLGKAAMEGAIGVFGGVLVDSKYPQWKKDAAKDPNGNACPDKKCASTGGWTGITDKYFMTVFAPPQSEPISARFQVTAVNGVDVYQTSYVGAARAVAPGASTSETTHVFAGAKVVKTLQAYGDALKLPNFDKAVDWGWFEILSKPVFMVLDTYAGWLATVGLGFGWAILALTITIRVLMFPAFNSSYAMSTKMKKVQPQMKALQERLKNDPPALQKEMMALYAKEKINPVTGCIPMLLPLPVFYALNNVFNVTIEMRQASFGWVKDLSAPDPTTIWNLFGLLPWDPLHNAWIAAIETVPFVGGIFGLVFHLGAWPIIYAATMWLSLLTGPTMTGIDPTQQRLMRWMPWVFMIVLAQSAVGLVIYWSFSSIFTMVQQYVLMRRFKVENPIDGFLARFAAKREPTAAE
jgi:YidC/Oxa1 family membrane protein insertase